MSNSQPARSGSGQLHFLAIVFVTVLVMVLGVLVVVAPDRMGVPHVTPIPVATPLATPAP